MRTWGVARLGTAIAGGAFLALGVFIGAETAISVPSGPAYAAVGPRAFPGIIAAGLVGVGLLHLRRALQDARTAPVDEAAPPYDWTAVLWIVGTLLAQWLLLPWLGWVPAAALVFVGVARAFGSQAWVPNTLIGAGLGSCTLLLFNQVLGLGLPMGQLLQWMTGR